jgi:hypothetical protein
MKAESYLAAAKPVKDNSTLKFSRKAYALPNSLISTTILNIAQLFW